MTEKKRPTLYLIDSSSLIFRAFFAIRNLSTSQGIPTNATYGFLTMLLGVLEKNKPDFIACVFDTPKQTFRKDIFPEYKANRSAPPDDLLPQFEQIQRVVESLGIARVAEPGFEADDVIATLSDRFVGCDVVIVTGDKDLMQLVDDRVRILDTMKNVLYGPAEVKEKLGVGPELVTDYLGMIGDTSDNIPGIPGVGPKTAVELLGLHGSMEAVLAAAPQMKEGKRKTTILENVEQARLSKRLATVEHKVPGHSQEVSLDAMQTPGAFTLKFIDILKEFEFKTLAAKLGAMVPGESAQVSVGIAKPKIHLVTTEQQWKDCLEKMNNVERLAFDTETRGNRTTEIEMVGMSLCADAENTYYIPVRHQGAIEQLSVKRVVADFQNLAHDKQLVAQNLKYDYKVFLNEGVDLYTRAKKEHTCFFDTMLAHYLVEPEEKHGLDALALKYFGTTIGDFKAVLGELPDFSHVPLDAAAEYGGLDSWATYALHAPLEKSLKELALEKLFYEIEIPTARVLAHIERNGVAVDVGVLDHLSKEYAVELAQIESEIFSTVGSTFNLNSPKQLSEILFQKLGLPTIQKTKTGFSTDVRVLEKLAPMHPVPALIVRYRELTKLKSTYVDVLPSLIEKDGRVHANFNQAVAATGRLSSSDPNLQNIPIKTASGRKIRKAFIAGPGASLVGADYSQIELRLVAHLSGDEALIEAFRSKQDVHRATAAEIFGVRAEQVTDAQRGAAKAINFGLIYGKTAFGLAQELNISRREAQDYIDAYFKRYSGVKRYMEDCMQRARQTKMAETMFGRKRPIRDIDSKNMGVRQNAERMAINTPVQGTAADIMKIAMVRVFDACQKLGAKVVLQVHDELVVDVAKEQSSEVLQILKDEMQGAVSISVPLDVNASTAQDWMEL